MVSPARARVEQTSEFFVSNPARSFYSGRRNRVCQRGGRGAVGLTTRTQYAASAARSRGVTSLTNDKTGPHGSKPPGPSKIPAKDVGDALRSVYDRAVNEDIPPEMLDLLGKLD